MIMVLSIRISGNGSKKYKAEHGNQSIPEKKDNRRDIFNGNIENPSEFLLVYIVLYAFIIGTFLALVVTNSNRKLEYHEISFTSFTEKGNDLLLFPTSSESYYKIISQYRIFTENTKLLMDECDDQTIFEAYTLSYNDKNQKQYDQIMSLRDKTGNVFLTLGNTTKQQNREDWILYTIFGSMLTAWSAFIILSLIAGRNPQKHKKLVRLVFKDGYIRYHTK